MKKFADIAVAASMFALAFADQKAAEKGHLDEADEAEEGDAEADQGAGDE